MKKIILGISVLSVVMMSSCSDFLTEEPVLKQSNELTLGKYDGLDNATAGLYAPLQATTWYGSNFILDSELRCGNAKNPEGEPGSGRYRESPFWNFNESVTSPIWTYANYTIARANNVINNLEGKTSSTVSEQDINNLKAEAKTLRALALFDLTITYAQPYTYDKESLGVPVVTVTSMTSPARNTVEECYAQIVKDLTEAEEEMSDKYQRAGALDNAATVTKPVIQALLSRVYLYMGEWQKAADYATKVIKCGKYNLAEGQDYIDMYSATTAPEKGEIIFEMFASKKNEYWDNSGWEMASYITNFGSDGSADVCATKDLVSLFDASDLRLKLFQEHEGDVYTMKYAGKTGSGAPKENNTIIIRLSEMYLNRAEAIVNGATVPGVTAAADLKVLADRNGVDAPSPSKTTVFNERRKELNFEGHIAFDYARTQTSLTRTDYNGLTNKDVPFPSPKWAMPIPKREMDANSNMVQNEGY